MVVEMVIEKVQCFKYDLIAKTDGKLISQCSAVRKSVAKTILTLLKVFKLQFWMSYFNLKMF